MSLYDADGMHVGERNTMRTYTDRHVDPMNVLVTDVSIIDIAHSLSRQCRFNGHCAGFISVANHCVRVHDLLAGTRHQPWGLMHDAAETWLGDIIRPMKYSGQFQAYFDAEVRAERVIAAAFDLEWPMPQAVKDADSKAAIHELENCWDLVSDPYKDEAIFLERFRRYWNV